MTVVSFGNDLSRLSWEFTVPPLQQQPEKRGMAFPVENTRRPFLRNGPFEVHLEDTEADNVAGVCGLFHRFWLGDGRPLEDAAVADRAADHDGQIVALPDTWW